MAFRSSLAVLSLLAISSSALAVEVAGVKMADHVKVEGKRLELNGTGVRKKFVVKVYVGGLYLEKRSQDAEEIASSDQLKSIEMVFLRGVGTKDIAEALAEGFKENCEGPGCEKLQPQVGQLREMLTQGDIQRGDVMAFNFLPEKVEVLLRGKKLGTVDGKDFSRQFIRCWIGKHPADSGLKEGLLGKDK